MDEEALASGGSGLGSWLRFFLTQDKPPFCHLLKGIIIMRLPNTLASKYGMKQAESEIVHDAGGEGLSQEK